MNSTSNSDIIIIEVIRQELTTAEVIKHIFIDEVIKHIRNSSMAPSGDQVPDQRNAKTYKRQRLERVVINNTFYKFVIKQ
jgi:hypothetical protein